MPQSAPATLRVLQSKMRYEGKQALTYDAGISAESVGSQHISMHLLTIPPHGKGLAHMHEDHETAIYILSGVAEVWFGEGLAEHTVSRAGDFIYIPASMPHQPYNPSDTEPCVVVLARTDPDEQESVVVLPRLDKAP
jgi:uncharacterized RmlC-like cupin family protein